MKHFLKVLTLIIIACPVVTFAAPQKTTPLLVEPQGIIHKMPVFNRSLENVYALIHPPLGYTHRKSTDKNAPEDDLTLQSKSGGALIDLFPTPGYTDPKNKEQFLHRNAERAVTMYARNAKRGLQENDIRILRTDWVEVDGSRGYRYEYRNSQGLTGVVITFAKYGTVFSLTADLTNTNRAAVEQSIKTLSVRKLEN
jgi:hypothetical protein